MQHFVIGTAGHIDHGKTAIIKALTNIDCDTHPEEKKRGITINPGFAYIKKPDGDYLAFVDVPGHQKFINNMVAGASGISFVMLVVAADDGVMPQTREHLRICSMLGVKNGIVVINKCDKVDSDGIDLCEDEIREFVRGTFLEGKPVFRLSAITGLGVDALRDYLLKGDYYIEPKVVKDFFRMSVDRCFNVAGFGAVVTGTVADGTIHKNDSLLIYPGEKECKVRNIQRHNESVEECGEGSRVAIDLTGVKKEDIELGDIISSDRLHHSRLFDVELKYIDNGQIPVEKKRLVVMMLTGTKKLEVNLRILEHNGDCGLAQAEMEHDWFGAYGDYLIFRDSSATYTLAGGRIIDPNPLIHKKSTSVLLERLYQEASGELQYIKSKVAEGSILYDLDFFSRSLLLSPGEVRKMIEGEYDVVDGVKPCIIDNYVLNCRLIDDFAKLLVDGLKKHNKSNPLNVTGIDRASLLGFAGDFHFCGEQESDIRAFSLALNRIVSEGYILLKDNSFILPGTKTELTEEEKGKINRVKILFQENYSVPLTEHDVAEASYRTKASEKETSYILRYLRSEKIIEKAGEYYFWSPFVNDVKSKITAHFIAHPGEGLRLGEFREISGTNRKNAFTLSEYLESQKFIIRNGDLRFLK